jgi:hypothetical protein
MLRRPLRALALSALIAAAPAGAQDGPSGEAPQAAPPDPWAVPAPGACQPEGGLLGGGPGADGDARPLPFAPGDVLGVDRLETLRAWIPDFLWEQRERFFFEGMRLEVGECFADYGPPAFFRDATERFAGEAKLTGDGGLVDYTAGTPFPPAGLAADDPQAGPKWLWNVQERYQGAGFRGKFRMTDLVGRVGRAEPFLGEIFKIRFAHRADRVDDDYTAPGARGKDFVAGGLFYEPFDAREYAWRQYRDLAHLTDAKRSDDLHAYLPQWRRVRRLNASRVEGLYMPVFSVGVQADQQLAVGGGAAGGIGAAQAAGGSGGSVGGTISTKRSGWEGLELRPILWDAKVLGLHDVLTPIRARTPAYPTAEDRDFGPWGLSFAGDRWDLRRALVLDLRARGGAEGDQAARQILYVDLQTLVPLYLATFDARDEMTNAGMYAWRWSGDRPDYPRWPDDPERPIRVLDSVGAAFANLSEAGSWRRESWDVVSTPPEDRTVKRMTSVNELTKGR